MKRPIIHLIVLSLGCYLLGEEAVVVSPPASPRISAQADYTKQEVAPNKVLVVNIAQPNAAGVSHNCYEKFNVNREGLILNNSTVAAQSKLGGMLMGNANLSRTGLASLIVNEVTGPTSMVSLRYMEERRIWWWPIRTDFHQCGWIYQCT